MSIEYFDDITFQYLTESDNGARFPYTTSENEILPIPHPESFHTFFRVEIWHEIGEYNDTFSEIK